MDCNKLTVYYPDGFVETYHAGEVWGNSKIEKFLFHDMKLAVLILLEDGFSIRLAGIPYKFEGKTTLKEEG